MSSPLRYTAFERIHLSRPVDRIEFVARACAGKFVLDLGAMDETAWQVKQGRGTWLHEEIGRAARRVVGIDSSQAVGAAGVRTAANAVIVRGDVTDPAPLVRTLDEVPEVIVAGELIEHLENPLQFLRRYVALEILRGRTLILTTPNATALHNCLIGFLGRESTHHDHLCILSYKTLATLCQRCGFAAWEIVPYFARFPEMRARHTGLARLAVGAGERTINGLEWCFPLMSFGYIVRASL
jgi:hypothetical protein